MHQVTTYQLNIVVSQVSAAPVYMDKYDQILIQIPAVSGVFSSSPVAFTLQGAPVAGGTTQEIHYYDYVGNTPNTCVVTVSTGGIYEFPNPGAMNYIGVSFDVAASQATTCYLITPRTTY